MSAPPQPAGAGGFAPPPFLARHRGPGGAHRWWSGLTGRGRTALSLSACVALAMIVILILSAGPGNGAPRTGTKPRKTHGSISAVSESLIRNVKALNLTILSWRLKMILNKMAAIAPEVERKLAELSQVVQGGLCGGWIARLQHVYDVPVKLDTVALEVPEDPEGSWRYANRLADEYLPSFDQCRRELRALRPRLVAIGPAPMKRSLELLLESCNLQLDAAGSFVRALRLVRDCNGMTVGQALELARAAASGIIEGSACLEGAFRPVAFIN